VRIPVIEGIIRRRVLVNFRADPEVVSRILPAPFRPKLARDHAVCGICLIRLESIRPRRLPPAVGLSSENAAHRFAVEWDDDAGRHEAVYIPRRDTSSALNALAGGRVFPGEHHHASFEIDDGEDGLEIEMRSDDGQVTLGVAGRVADALPAGSVFESLDAASRFFEGGSLGYSVTAAGDRLDGVVLKTLDWKLEPLAIERASSSWFSDPARFPPGSIELDHALLMRNLAHEWHAAPDLTL
jgi:hypothetical protein